MHLNAALPVTVLYDAPRSPSHLNAALPYDLCFVVYDVSLLSRACSRLNTAVSGQLRRIDTICDPAACNLVTCMEPRRAYLASSRDCVVR